MRVLYSERSGPLIRFGYTREAYRGGRKNIFSDWNRQPEDILENIPPELDTVQEK